MINEVLRNVELLKTEIQEQMTAQGITASGKTAGSLHIVQDDLGIRLISDNSGAPISTIEAGREGGKIPFNFKDIIVEWSKDKGLSFASEEEREKICGSGYFREKWNQKKRGSGGQLAYKHHTYPLVKQGTIFIQYLFRTFQIG